MKEQLLEKLNDPRVKNKIIEITTDLFKEIWDAFNDIDRDKIYLLFYPNPGIFDPKPDGPDSYDPIDLKTPFFYYDPEKGFGSETKSQYGRIEINALPLIDETDDSLFEMASQKINFNEKLKSQIQTILSKEVLNKFESPLIATVEELCQVYENLAMPTMSVSRMNLEELYLIFIEKIRHSTLGVYRSKFFTLGEIFEPEVENSPVGQWVEYVGPGDERIGMPPQEGRFGKTIYKESFYPPHEVILWSKNGIVIRVIAIDGSRRRVYASGMTIKIELCGCMTPKVFDSMSENLTTLVRTIHRSYFMLCEKEFSRPLEHNSDNYYITYPYEDYSLFVDKLKACFGDYFSVPDKKDTINRRIRNAVSLLIESDAQNNKAISTSLSIAAIEALLGEKGAEISEKISTNIAVLLEPDLNKRTAAEKFFKDLYNLRSRTLHGESLEDEEKISEKARHLAAAVLDAVITLRDFLMKSGFSPKSPQDLLSELKASKYRSGNVICEIKDYNVRCYWGKNTV